MPMNLSPNETDLVAQWIKDGDRVVSDDVNRRIEWLIEHQLQKIAPGPSGWEILYRDTRDGRYWELTYPQGEMHGGGPKRLTNISSEEALRRYRRGTVAIISGMRAEAALLPRGVRVVCTGGRAGRAYDEARRLLTEGAAGLLSFGIAGGLDPALKSGALVVATAVVVREAAIDCDTRWVERLRAQLASAASGPIFGATDPVAYPAEKMALHRRWQALTIDLESGGMARACAEAGKPFAVLRAVADPGSRAIPRAALAGLTESGRMNPFAVARGLLARPGDLPALMKLGSETRTALAVLADAARRLGPTLGFEALAPFIDQ